MLRHVIRAVAVIALFAARPLLAQCADGSAPPCRSTQVAQAPRAMPIDPNRVAVIPFRVTTADSLFGEGFAELLALEFTGEGGPRSIDMATTIAGWRRTGGGLRSPVTQDVAMRLARDLGAGVLCQGTVVGLGGRLTISASLVDATTGRTIGAPARATGSADSIDALLGQVATGLLGAGVRAQGADAGRLTKSPAAMRAYLEGLALRRRGHREAAAAAFEASFAADTTFASAAYQRWLVAALIAGSTEWEQKTWALKARLTQDERTMVEARVLVPGSPRTPPEVNSALRQAAMRIESPEAWYFYGDDVYHNGLAIVGPDSVWPMARRAFDYALALDSQPIGIGHLTNIALRTRDTALARAIGRIFERLDGEDSWSSRWVISGSLGDAAQIDKLRQVGPPRQSMLFTGLPLAASMDATIPMALVEEGYQHVNRFSNPTERDRNAINLWLVQRARGRPAKAEQSFVGQTPPHWRAALGAGFATAISGDSHEDEAFVKAFGSTPVSNQGQERRRQCTVARVAAQRGEAAGLDIPMLRRRTVERCATVLAIWKAFATNTLTDSALSMLDGLVSTNTTVTFLGFEHRLLAGIYESRGDTARALRAVRHYPRDFAAVWVAPTLREEGKYFLMARDTANAVKSYRHFLELRAEAEPPYVAERDSIRALIANLTRRR